VAETKFKLVLIVFSTILYCTDIVFARSVYPGRIIFLAVSFTKSRVTCFWKSLSDASFKNV